jgi:hypothetical protein
MKLILRLASVPFAVGEAVTQTCRLYCQTSWHGGGTGASVHLSHALRNTQLHEQHRKLMQAAGREHLLRHLDGY